MYQLHTGNPGDTGCEGGEDGLDSGSGPAGVPINFEGTRFSMRQPVGSWFAEEEAQVFAQQMEIFAGTTMAQRISKDVWQNIAAAGSMIQSSSFYSTPMSIMRATHVMSKQECHDILLGEMPFLSIQFRVQTVTILFSL